MSRSWLLSLLTAAVIAPAAFAESQAPTGLMIDLVAMPQHVAIADARPRFTWIVNDAATNAVQSAYEVRVAPGADQLDHPTWDSGKVDSDQSVAIPFGGTPLAPGAYAWQVRTWDRGGAAGPWSEPQPFTVVAPAAGGDRTTVARYPLVQTPIKPTAVIEVAPGHYFLDFGRDAYAALKLTFNPPQSPCKVTVSLGEALSGPHVISPKPGGSIRYHKADLTLDPGRREYVVPLTPNDDRRMPKEIGPVMPFRYVEVENAPEPLTTDSAVQLATHYPFDDDAAKFECSDPNLNAIWDLCHYSMKATSFCGVFVDGDRERLPYEADAYINALGWFACNREFTLPRASGEHLIQHPTWPTEWPLHSVFLARADYQYTGDLTSAAAFYDDLKTKTLYPLERDDGLISTKPSVPKKVLAALHEKRLEDVIDWPPGERDGYDLRPVNTVVQAMHYIAINDMAELAEALGKAEDAESFHTRARRIEKSINEKLFNESTGLYVDGEGSAHSSLHANMLPLVAGLVPADREPKVAQFVASRGMACSVYGAQYLMEALFRTGQADHAIQLMAAPGDRSWLHMIRDVGTTITLEAWDNKYKPNQDWNHAWGAAPANLIPRCLMGIKPTAPGFKTVRVRPMIGKLAHASIELPTVRGPIHLSCDQSAGKFTADLRIPANMTAEVWVPATGSDDSTVLVDGAKREGKPAAGGFVVIEGVGSGPHRFERAAAASVNPR